VGFFGKKPQTLMIPIYSTTVLYDLGLHILSENTGQLVSKYLQLALVSQTTQIFFSVSVLQKKLGTCELILL